MGDSDVVAMVGDLPGEVRACEAPSPCDVSVSPPDELVGDANVVGERGCSFAPGIVAVYLTTDGQE